MTSPTTPTVSRRTPTKGAAWAAPAVAFAASAPAFAASCGDVTYPTRNDSVGWCSTFDWNGSNGSPTNQTLTLTNLQFQIHNLAHGEYVQKIDWTVWYPVRTDRRVLWERNSMGVPYPGSSGTSVIQPVNSGNAGWSQVTWGGAVLDSSGNVTGGSRVSFNGTEAPAFWVGGTWTRQADTAGNPTNLQASQVYAALRGCTTSRQFHMELTGQMGRRPGDCGLDGPMAIGTPTANIDSSWFQVVSSQNYDDRSKSLTTPTHYVVVTLSSGKTRVLTNATNPSQVSVRKPTVTQSGLGIRWQ